MYDLIYHIKRTDSVLMVNKWDCEFKKENDPIFIKKGT